MKMLTKIFTFCISLNMCLGQELLPPPPEINDSIFLKKSYKKYYFEDVNFVEENKELVIIVKDPQTQFAKDFGHKIYSDTAFLNHIQRELYTVIDPNKVQEEILHMCGYDMYFYVKSGPNLKLLKTENSNCSFGSTDCSMLTMFNENGTPLIVDTIRTLKRNYLKHIDQNFIYGCFVTLESNHELWQDPRDWDASYFDVINNSSFSNSIYNGQFELSLTIDHTKSIIENVEDFFKSRGIDSLEFREINFELKNSIDAKLPKDYDSPRFSRKDNLEFRVYLNKKYFSNFRDYNIQPIKRLLKRKYELKNEPLLIIHKK